MGSERTKVLVVEDSPVVQMLLVHLLKRDPQVEVVGVAGDGEEGVAKAAELKPHVIIMDIQMPRMNGHEATRRIMATNPIPIVICSAHRPDEVNQTFRAMEAGALAFVDKPVGIGQPGFEAMAQNLIETTKLTALVRVTQGRRRTAGVAARSGEVPFAPRPGRIRVVAIGASTGGPIVLQTILKRLPRDFPAPVVAVQHIAAGFVGGMADWLTETTGVQARVGKHGEKLLPARVYLAPDDVHMGIRRGDVLNLAGTPPENGVRPAISHLFRSVREVCGGDTVVVLLSGMGRDGADELKHLRMAGAVTIVQDEASSVVHGMPGEAIKIDAATHILPPEGIAAALTALAGTNARLTT
jgi:two-component system chemotaxis response regulator CheB